MRASVRVVHGVVHHALHDEVCNMVHGVLSKSSYGLVHDDLVSNITSRWSPQSGISMVRTNQKRVMGL